MSANDEKTDALVRYMDRMAVHAALTARHLDLSVEEAVPAIVAMAVKLAVAHGCVDASRRRVGYFLLKKGYIDEAEFRSWR